MGFNFGNWMNDNVFKKNEMKQITSTVGGIFGKGMSFMEGISNNILNMSKGLTNMLSSPILLPALAIGGIVFILIRTKMI